jgi:hypothetical protein
MLELYYLPNAIVVFNGDAGSKIVGRNHAGLQALHGP